jgi:C1A family cysteine protease
MQDYQMVDRKYGWRPDKPDFRDHILKYGALGTSIDATVDLRETGHLPDVYDQGQIGSCTGNAIAGAIAYAIKAQSKPVYTPSRLFIYYNERVIENTVDQDAGAEIRDGIKSVASTGVCDENLWPYDTNQFTVKPSDTAYSAAQKGIIKQYARVPVALHNIQNVLTHKVPVVIGCSLYQSFESDAVAATGMVPMPDANENQIGGHCMLLVGYTKTHFIVRNSWGPDWGDKGYCYMPFDYLTDPNLSDDFWAIFLA